jgi:hypothetical protein
VKHEAVLAPMLGLALGCAPTDDVVGVVSTGSTGSGGAGACATGATLKHRADAVPVSVVTGQYEGTSATSWPLIRNGDYVTLRGQGYLNERWQIEYATRAGLITLPISSVGSGTFLRVGGGARNLGDPQPGTTGTWLGNAQEGLSYMPDGVQPPWLNEFYYLDGEVTITQNESDGLYNLTVSPQTFAQVTTPGWGVYDPGIVCDPE